MQYIQSRRLPDPGAHHLCVADFFLFPNTPILGAWPSRVHSAHCRFLFGDLIRADLLHLHLSPHATALRPCTHGCTAARLHCCTVARFSSEIKTKTKTKTKANFQLAPLIASQSSISQSTRHACPQRSLQIEREGPTISPSPTTVLQPRTLTSFDCQSSSSRNLGRTNLYMYSQETGGHPPSRQDLRHSTINRGYPPQTQTLEALQATHNLSAIRDTGEQGRALRSHWRA